MEYMLRTANKTTPQPPGTQDPGQGPAHVGQSRSPSQPYSQGSRLGVILVALQKVQT